MKQNIYSIYYNGKRYRVKANTIQDAKKIGDKWYQAEPDAITSMYIVEEGSYYTVNDWARVMRPLYETGLKGWEGCAR